MLDNIIFIKMKSFYNKGVLAFTVLTIILQVPKVYSLENKAVIPSE
jgi:hypothetical protein